MSPETKDYFISSFPTSTFLNFLFLTYCISKDFRIILKVVPDLSGEISSF